MSARVTARVIAISSTFHKRPHMMERQQCLHQTINDLTSASRFENLCGGMETECGDLKPNITANAKFWPHIINHRQLGGPGIKRRSIKQGDKGIHEGPVVMPAQSSRIRWISTTEYFRIQNKYIYTSLTFSPSPPPSGRHPGPVRPSVCPAVDVNERRTRIITQRGMSSAAGWLARSPDRRPFLESIFHTAPFVPHIPYH